MNDVPVGGGAFDDTKAGDRRQNRTAVPSVPFTGARGRGTRPDQAGVAHAAVTVNGKLWDCVAPAAIVLEAGGKLTDFQGKSIFPFKLQNYAGAKVPFLAAAPLAHEPLLREMRNNA